MKKNPRSIGISSSGGSEKIKIRYRNDLNLNELSERILTFLDNEKIYQIPRLDEELEILGEKVKKPQFPNERRLDLKAVEVLQERKKELLSGNRREEFLELTQPLLDRYSTLGILEDKAVFGVEEVEVSEDSEKSRQRSILISQYLEACRKFAPLEVEKKYTPNYNCGSCNYDLEECIGPDDSSEIVCPQCGMITQIFKQYSSSKNGSIDSDYEDRENFIRAKERFQGKQNIIFPDKFYSDLDAFFTSRSLPTGDEVRAMEKVSGRRGPQGLIGKKILRKALANKGYNNHYDDINLIAHEYWNWDLPDISHLDEILEGDYDKTEKIFKQIKGSKRKATINTQWRLEAQLRARKYPVQNDDFKIIETPAIMEQYNAWWKVMVAKCGDPTLTYVKT